jgi:hypothetical protein
LGVSVEGSSPERHLHGGAIEAEGLTGARPKEGWVAPVVGLESRLFVGRCSVVHNTAGNQRGGNVPWSISVVCWDGEVRCISGILVMVPVGSDGGRRWGGTGEGPWRSEELGVWCSEKTSGSATGIAAACGKLPVMLGPVAGASNA